MNIARHGGRRKLSSFSRLLTLFVVAAIMLCLVLPSLSLPTRAAKSRYQTGYTFDNADAPRYDISGNYNIPDSSEINPVSGFSGSGNKAVTYLDAAMFTDNIELTVALRVKLDAEDMLYGKSIFYAGSYAAGTPYFYIEYASLTNFITVTLFSDSKICSVPMAVPTDISADDWSQLTVTLGYSDANFYVKLYLNGVAYASGRSYGTLENFGADIAYFSDFSTDEVYITNYALTENEVSLLYTSNLDIFMLYEDSEWHEAGTGQPDEPPPVEPPVDPEIPVDPTEPDNPDWVYYPRNPDRTVTPVTDLSWVAYTFENTFDLTHDLNSRYPMTMSVIGSTSVNTAGYNGSFGKGLTRRWTAYPDSVFSFNEGLLYTSGSFTVAAWVYFESKPPVTETVKTTEVKDEDTGEVKVYYTYYNKEIPALKGTGITRIFDVNGNRIDISSCFTYDKYGKVSTQTLFYAYDKDGRLLDLINGKYLDLPGKYYYSESGVLYSFETALPYAGTPVWKTIPATPATSITTDLFNFVGRGALVFSPFSTGEDGTAVSTFSYGASRSDLTVAEIGKAASVDGKWVHYAFTFDRTGTVSIYTNGILSKTVNTGLRLSDLRLCNLDMLAGASETENGRFIIDEIYLSSKVLSPSDIRKLRFYGISRYVAEALADPNPDASDSQPTAPTDEEIDLRPDETDELEDKYIETAVINNFIGTSFDDSTFIGKDYNGAAAAAVRNASLKQGIKTYGLALNGLNSYIRYPQGILNGAPALTVSIAYNWNGVSAGTRSQRLFDFSRKTQSVDTPTAYIALLMGDGMSGVEVTLSDGSKTTVLNSGINVTNKWVRATVIVDGGKVNLYLDSTLVASTATSVDISKINPNFSYIGKSGVKGDPLFSGAVDEIYISNRAITDQELLTLVNDGVEPVEQKEVVTIEENFEDELWDNIIKGVLIATGLLVLIVIIVIIITIIKK